MEMEEEKENDAQQSNNFVADVRLHTTETHNKCAQSILNKYTYICTMLIHDCCMIVCADRHIRSRTFATTSATNCTISAH
jgi:hypothetical protein